MTISPIKKEKCTPQHKKYPKQIRIPKNTDNSNAIFHKSETADPMIKGTLSQVKSQLPTQRDKLKAINFPQSIRIQFEQKLTQISEVTLIMPQKAKIYCTESKDLKDTECMRDSKNPTISLVAILKMVNQIL